MLKAFKKNMKRHSQTSIFLALIRSTRKVSKVSAGPSLTNIGEQIPSCLMVRIPKINSSSFAIWYPSQIPTGQNKQIQKLLYTLCSLPLNFARKRLVRVATCSVLKHVIVFINGFFLFII